MSTGSESRQCHVLAVNPFHGGSHRQFLSSVVGRSKHRWTVVTGKPVHWKWRMRSAPLELSRVSNDAIAQSGKPDLVFCTDMLDLPCWRGLMRCEDLQRTPTVIYFHENQWTYPVSPSARPDVNFGYTNLLSAMAADACWFNSEYHRRDFLDASEAFVRRMPDARSDHDFKALWDKSKVIYPGFEPTEDSDVEVDVGNRSTLIQPSGDAPVTIGWVSRWEHDKRPDRFRQLLDRLSQSGIPFRLILLGPRPQRGNADLDAIRRIFRDRIEHDGFAEQRDYQRLLNRMDLVVATADHEFFGIAICEAIWAGAMPILPDRLSYPELVPTQCLYQDLDQAETLITEALDANRRRELSRRCRQQIEPMQTTAITQQIDACIDQLMEEAGA